ncbi:WxL domain-containing protein [Lactiplantibacillus nangangensis]|uniref:WxL domain-containing protein n=1 Tax=Lactiplantibacillus nangangensis TaxID=2559917 RepID=A0ABW1SIN7_9LACO|nr:WxL domain-containing protein [Lactiplantibacillus nangangensis]
MKKMLLGLLLSATLLGGTAVTANAADAATGQSDGTVSFTGGDLTLDATGAGLDFGSNKITDQKETYNNQTANSGVKVSDLRGTGAGWSLSVTQQAQFKNGDTTDAKELKGAAINLNGVLDTSNVAGGAPTLIADSIPLTPTASTMIAGAKADAGLGTTTIVYDTSTLDVPQSAIKLAGSKYTTTLFWNLGATPIND